MTDVQEALEAAFEEHETETHEPHGTKELLETTSEETTDGKQESTSEESQDEESGKTENTEESGETTDGEHQEPGTTDSDPEKSESVEVKPPAGWTPGVREKFKDLPEDVQQEVTKREKEIAYAMQQSGEARKMMEPVQKLFGQFQHLFNANGTDPITGTGQILQTAAQLQQGTPQQKVNVISNMIRSFGVDVQLLDSALSGQQQKPADPHIAYLEKELQELKQQNQQVKQQTYQQLQAQQTKINEEVEKFVKNHEFSDDLRGVMADFIDLAEQQGSPIDLETAYTRALATRPDLQQILANRKTRTDNQQSVDKARQANVSLPQQTSTEPASKTPDTLRGALEAAFEGS